MGPERRPFPLSVRGGTLLGIAVAGLLAAGALRLAPGDLVPSRGGLEIAGRFFSRALSPALAWEADFVPEGSPPILGSALDATAQTVAFAAAAMLLALVLSVPLAFLASRAWWEDEPAGGRTWLSRALTRAVLPAVWGTTRATIAILRSVHELLWAVLFLAAFGLVRANAVLAIALPYAATLAKVFSEMLDEAHRGAAAGLQAVGATPLQVFAFGLVPRALPDMGAYAFYRFECALRSAAVLGFFGYPTLGLHVRMSFQRGNYGETWTFLYALVAVILLLEVWSGALRRRIVA